MLKKNTGKANKKVGVHKCVRHFFIVSSALLLLTSSANAKVFEFPFQGDENLSGIAAIYDENNVLTGVQSCSITSLGNGNAQISVNAENFGNIKFYIPSSNTLISELTEADERAEENPKDDTVVSDDKKDDTIVSGDSKKDDISGGESSTKKYPAAYPSELDAVTAFMVVKEAGTAVIDDELKNVLSVYFRGSEYELVLDEDKTIESASDAYPELSGASLSSLTEGDVIYASSSLGKSIRSIELICRAPQEDIVTSPEDYGTGFEKLYSRAGKVTSRYPSPISVFGAENREERQYAFGVIKDKQEKSITLCNQSGYAKDDIKIKISPDTIVYVYDNSARKSKLSIEDISYIEKSEFDKSLMDGGNITAWSDEQIHNYALVRMTEGHAMEIVLYLNY